MIALDFTDAPRDRVRTYSESLPWTGAMYFRKKTSGGRAYLQIVESRREGAAVRQQVIATLGRVEDLRESGQLERLLRSGARFAAKAIVVDAVAAGEATTSSARRIGPALAFERLWEETGCRGVIETLASARHHDFALERAVFLTVLHRLFSGGSDRAADRWRLDYRIGGVEGLDLHHLYRAMAWLGGELAEDQQDAATPFAPRCLKDVVEEDLFARRRDLFSTLDLVFMDTTSLYFEGAGGQRLGRRGFSKDHRPDLNQMILAVLLDGDGRPVCTEMWPGNTADAGSLIPVVDRLRKRFSVRRVCVVADRGMISAETIAELEARGLLYILGVRERTDKLVRDLVLDDPAPFVPLVLTKRNKDIEYEAKAVTLTGRRYGGPRRDPGRAGATVEERRQEPRSATRAIVVSSPRTATTVSSSIGPRRKRTSSSTASSCCAPTPISRRSKRCFATSSYGGWNGPSERRRACSPRGRSFISSTRPFAATSRAVSLPSC